ncbi:MAG: glycosyltransferase family 2 protein [Pyrinomonadaceae bacterium]|nr:glycosyltransferase family 2 protein [Pyrinomonadaceae bacterium]
MTAPLLSVVIPTWNRARLVCEAVESALSQRIGQVEVIVVDDGSTDDTANVLTRNFGSRISLLRLPSRRGVSAARNAGVRLATGELLAFLDSDDLWLPGKLDAELRVLERFPDAEAVVSDNLLIVEGQADDRSRFARTGLLAATQGQPRWVSECHWLWTNSMNAVQMSSMILRREALARMEGALFAEDLVWCEDWEFQMRVYHSCRVVVLPEVWTWARCLDDGARLGRWDPGKPRTREQEAGLLRGRLTVIERSHWLTGLDSELAAELQRFRDENTSQLARLESPRIM